MTLWSVGLSIIWIAVTVACYFIGLAVRAATRHAPLANPALIAIILVSTALLATHTSYETYFHATWLLTFVLGPATIALGVPLAKHFERARRSLTGVGVGLLAGSVVSMLSGVVLVRLFGGSKMLAMSMLPKAATTPIAMDVAEQIGGEPALTATLAILGGIITAVTIRAVLGSMRIRDESAIGLAAGTAGSGIAAAHAAEMSDTSAAFAAIGVGLNGLLTALLAPALAVLVT